MDQHRWKFLAGLLVVAIATALSAPLRAETDTSTEARLEKLEAKIQALQTELAELKIERVRQSAMPAGIGVYQEQIDKMVARALEKNAAESNAQQTYIAADNPVTLDQEHINEMVAIAFDEQKSDFPTLPEWLGKTTFFGDFRYRHEDRNVDAVDAVDRGRDRIRARLGFDVAINEDFNAIFRLATGSSDTPVSTNQTLGGFGVSPELLVVDNDSFSSRAVWIDWAYANWHPRSAPGLDFYAGKMKQPFFRVGKNQLIWDNDVSPEGIAGGYTFDIDDLTALTVNGGGFWLKERSGAQGGADTSLWGVQTLAVRQLGENTHLLAGATYYDFGNLKNETLDGVDLNGNTNDGMGGYAFDFNIVEAFGEYAFPLWQMPSSFYATYAENVSAPSKKNTACLLGARINELTERPGSWQFDYNWREIASDAVLGGLNDSNFMLGGTGGRGHQLRFRYRLMENFQGVLSWYITERDPRGLSDRDKIDIIQTDLIFEF